MSSARSVQESDVQSGGSTRFDLRQHLGAASLRDMPGWGISLLIHIVAMVVLLAFRIHVQAEPDASILSALEDIESETIFDSTVTDQVGNSPEPTSLVAAPGVVSAQSSEAVQESVQASVNQEFKSPEVAIADEATIVDIAELTHAIDDPSGGTENLSGAGGVEGAIDRLTFEIQQSLHQRKTTVIWLFDQSLSLKERRDAIADRFENVYRQLESLEAGGKGALTTVAATFGEKFSLLTDKPLEDVRPLIAKVRSIPNDPKGIENVFSAVHTLATKFRSERAKGRSVLIFIITDEKGDDAEKYLEETITLCRRTGIKVYVVGNAALFGREKGYVTWKYPDESTEDLEVDAGPETVEPEALALGFWGNRGPDLVRMSSGYGPYALSRLTKETGGMYFIAQEDRRGPRFSPAVMRNYQPDYRPIREYVKSLEKNKAKGQLVLASKQTKLETILLPQLEFPAYNDNILRERVTEAQKPAAELIYKIDRIVEAVRVGEKDREKISEPRWRAAYDLAMGRSLAMKVRAFGYNQMLADMKGQPKTFQKRDSNEWRILPSKTINAGQAVKKLEREAATYLKRVIDEHPETPWALLAERELSTPMGWEWHEFNNASILPANTSPEEARRQIRLAEERRRQEASKRPAMPARERPKL